MSPGTNESYTVVETINWLDIFHTTWKQGNKMILFVPPNGKTDDSTFTS